MKCLINDVEFKDLALPYSEILTHHVNEFNFIQGTMTSVNKAHTITVKLNSGTSKTIPFDILIIATGFSYSEPIKDSTSTTIEQRLKVMD